MTRNELIELGQKIVEVKGRESKLDELEQLFNRNVPHPEGLNLFFYPENYNARRDDLSKYTPTIEEMVDKCLSYTPIQL